MKRHRQAVFWLIAATAVWGISFPIMRVLHFRHETPGNTWLLSSWVLAARCLATGVLLAIFQPGLVRNITKREWMQSLGLIAFGGPGLLFQADGLAETDASTSAFLTQFYCVLLPLWACLRLRTLPSKRITICTLLVLTGMAVLAKLDLKTLHLGTGEWKTILAATFFTGQILMLEQPQFAENRSGTITLLGMTGTGLLSLLVSVPATHDWEGFFRPWLAVPDLTLMLVLTVGCTLFSYLMMNRWQRFVSATEAGLIYCMEPVFTAVFVLFVPAMLGRWIGTPYENEPITMTLLVGGGLVTLANLVLQLKGKADASKNST